MEPYVTEKGTVVRSQQSAEPMVTSGEQGYIKLQHWKGGAGECGLWSGPPSCPFVLISQHSANLFF